MEKNLNLQSFKTGKKKRLLYWQRTLNKYKKDIMVRGKNMEKLIEKIILECEEYYCQILLEIGHFFFFLRE